MKNPLFSDSKAALKDCVGILALIIAGTLAGCGLFGTNPSAPSAVENAVYDVQTNFVTQIVTQTNSISVTNQVTVFTTNTVGQIVTVTNQVVQNIPIVVTVSNSIPTYTLTTSGTATAAATGIGAAANVALPGLGSAITMGILAILGAWGHLRSYKSTQTSTGLTQEVQTILQFVQALPNGADYVPALKDFLQKHQNDLGTATQVLTLIKNQVNKPEAKVAAAEIIQAINALQSTTTKIAAPTLATPAA